jgi:hypothetical protein
MAADLVRDRFVANGHAADCTVNALSRAMRCPCDCGYQHERIGSAMK